MKQSLPVMCLLASSYSCYKLRFIDSDLYSDDYDELMTLSHRNNYILSEKEALGLDIVTYPYTEPFTYNNMRDKLTAHI